MNPTPIITAALLATLGACTTTGIGTTVLSDEAARAAARAVVTPIVAQQVPGPLGVAMADCIINNASAAELLTLARSATTGVNADTVTLTSQILARPATVTCATSAIAT